MSDTDPQISGSLWQQLQDYFGPTGPGRDMLMAAPWGAPALANALPYDWSNVRFQLNQVPQAIDAVTALGSPSQPAAGDMPAGERSVWATTGRIAGRLFGPEYQPQTPQGEQAKQLAEMLASFGLARRVGMLR